MRTLHQIGYRIGFELRVLFVHLPKYLIFRATYTDDGENY